MLWNPFFFLHAWNRRVPWGRSRRRRRCRDGRSARASRRALGPSQVGFHEGLEERVVLAPIPVVAISDTGTAMIGQDFNFHVSFENQASGAPSVGYGPYIDLFLDTTGADGQFPDDGTEPTDFDGLGPITATHLGVPLRVTPVPLGPGGAFVHPFATDATGNPLVGTAPAGFVEGDTLYVIELPFGSFVDAQPTAEVSIQSQIHPEADLGIGLNIAATGGFRYGADAVDNPTVDTPVRGTTVARTIMPTVVALSKSYNGPEDETATGPNFPRRYTISVDIGDGQTVTDLRVTDVLPDNVALLSVTSISPSGGIIERQPAAGSPQNAPNNELVVNFPSVTGTAGVNDASITIEFFVPELDADGNPVVSPTSGDDVFSLNDARLTGNWFPIDPSDDPAQFQIVDQASGADNHRLSDQSIAIQKSVRILTDTGAPGPTPGDTMLYTLDFQISDYFSFGDLRVEDLLSDGQRLVGSPSGPFPGPFELTVSDRQGSVSGNFTPSIVPGASNLFIDTSSIGNDLDPATDGSTRLLFDLSRAMVDLGLADGILQGGRAIVPGAGPATGTIRYRTVIQQEFTDTYPSGQPTVDQGDRLNNQVSISGSVRDNADLTTVLGSESDDSSAGFRIVTGDLLKTVYAINGALGPDNAAIDSGTGLRIGPSFPEDVRVHPGDVVTYRIRYTLPTGDVEQFRLADYLPLPVFDVSSFSTSLNTVIDSTVPVPGTAKYGPHHTFSVIPPGSLPTRDPLITVDAVANSLTFDFGTFETPPPEEQTVADLLFSVAVTDAPMADGLYLTNQALAYHGTTNSQPVVDEALIHVLLTQPELQLRKGIVSTTNALGTFSQTTAPTGIQFEAPGLVTPDRSFAGGTIQSSNLGTTIDADLSNVDAGDLVKFAIVIENTGSSTNGAFDVRVRDDLPSGYLIPATGPGLNLEVFDGTGALIPYATLGAGLFDPLGGIELLDPGPTAATVTGSPPATRNGGAIDGFDVASGRNLAIITFDLQLADSVQPGQTSDLLNTATLFHYAGLEGGPDHTDRVDPTDSAQVTVAVPLQSKAIDSTSEDHTGLVSGIDRVAIGEIVRYRLTTQLPEGQSPDFRLQDQLPNGLQFLDDGTATLALVATGAGGVTSSDPTLAAASVAGDSLWNPTFVLPATSITNGPFTNGRDPIFALGTLTNHERDADAEFVIVEFNALVLNSASASNDAGDTRNNRYRTLISGDQSGAWSSNTRIRVVEPAITVTKSATPTTVDAGDTVTYTVVFSNATGVNRSTAFDVRLLDPLPADLVLDSGSLTITPAGGATGITNHSTGNSIEIGVEQMPPGSGLTLVYTALVGPGISPAEVQNNSAVVTYTSLPGPSGTSINPTGSATPGNAGADLGERTGAGTGTNDYRATAIAPVTGRLPALSKIIVGTSINTVANGPAEVVVGELVTYELVVTIPEGQTDVAQIVDTLDPGLAFVDVLSVAYSPALSVANSIGTGPTPSNVNITSGGANVTFDFGSIVNSDTNNASSETITVRYRAVALNTADNQSLPQTELNNAAEFRWASHQLSPVSAPVVRVIEPDLEISKTADRQQIDGSDRVAFTIHVRHASTGSTDAYDLTVSDLVPAGFQYVSGSLNHVSGVVPASFGESAGLISAVWPVLLLGEESVFQFQVDVDPLVQVGSSLTNVARLDWTSVPGPTDGDLSIYNPNSRERTGSGGINDYSASGSVTVNVPLSTSKSLVATSEASTSNRDVTIGEIVRYRLATRLPEGTAPGFQVIDELPTGLQFLDDGSARFAFVSNEGGIESSSLGDAAVQIGNSGNITPTFVFPSSAISGGPFTAGVDPVFSFGDLTNRDNDADSEYVVLEFNALVANTAENVRGATQVNRYQTFVAGNPLGSPSNAITTTVVEPAIQGTTKTVVTPASGQIDAGQAVTYAVRYSNGSATGVAAAFDVQLTDSLPTTLGSLRNVRVYRNGSLISDGFLNRSSASLLDVTVAIVAPGDDIEIRYDATVGAAALPGATIQNTASLQYTSLPGQTGVIPNPTGSVTGPAGAVTGERTGSGGVNNYFDGSSSSLTLHSHTLAGSVYHDQNNNGLFDDGAAAAIVGVTVQLAGSDHLGATVMRTAVTDATGRYSFTGLRPGDYVLTEIQPTGYLNGMDSVGTPALQATNADRYDDRLATFSIAVGTASVTSDGNNFGELRPAAITGSVYVDANNDGLRIAESGIVGVTLRLNGWDDQGNSVTRLTTTDSTGGYQFDGLRPGTYQVSEVQPPGYVDGFETQGNVTPIPGSAGGPDTVGPISLTSGNVSENVNFGEVPSSRLVGRVFADIANDGYFTGNDFGLGGVLLELTGVDVNGRSVTRTTTTAPDGTYEFADLWAGTYSVIEPAQVAGYFDGRDSRNNVPLPGTIGTDRVDNIIVNIGASAVGNNFAEVPVVDPTGYVYIDANRNGRRDPAEMGVPGVPVTLTGASLDVFGNSVLPQTAYTDANGFYQFRDLPPGRYTLTETQPATLQDGMEQNGFPPAAVVNNDQFVDIDLTNHIVGGEYNFGELSPSASLAGSVYVDQNNNGQREPNEIGLAGVTVTIIDQSNPSLRVSVITDSHGNYRFVKLFPGTYRLRQTQPINFVDGRDSAGSAGGTVTNDIISHIAIGPNEAATDYLFGELGVDPGRISKREFLTSANPSSDFTGPAGSGLAAVGVPLADPSGFVYVDQNEDGQRQVGEPGIMGVRIELTGATASGATLHQQILTDENGFYQFAYLPPGTYALRETQPVGFLDGTETVGSHGGQIEADGFTQIVLAAGDIGVDYNFGERLPDFRVGDIDGDGVVQSVDVDAFLAAVRAQNIWYDRTGDQRVDVHDVWSFVADVFLAAPGDANLDGRFDSSDLVDVLTAGQYEDSVLGNSTWSTGDWNGDGEFSAEDLVVALQRNDYSRT